MGTFIDPADLAPFATIEAAKAAAMIEDAESKAILTAPCLADLHTAPEGETPGALTLRNAKIAAVKGILRAALLRWDESGSGVIQTETTGPFQKTVQTAARRSMFWPSEITDLQGICKDPDSGKAIDIDTAPTAGLSGHAPCCDLMFPGGESCSCGANLTGGLYPLWEIP